METSNKLVYKVSKTIGKNKIDVTIRLDENCKNGYEYFSMTCDGYEKIRSRWIYTFGGSAHDEILKVFPEFEIFKTVHLWSFGGFGMSTVANGFYFIKNGFDSCDVEDKNFPEYFCKYLTCTLEQFDVLKDSENQFEFSVLLIELGIVKGWKKIINKAISELEKLTGLKFKSKYEKDKNDITINFDKLKEFKQKEKEGFYTVKEKQKRESKRLNDLKTAMIMKVNTDYNNAIKKHQKELEVNLELIKQGFEISPQTGNIKGAIYYTHSNKLNFNWSSEKIKESKILTFVKNLDKEKFAGLKITNNKKEVAII